MATATSATTALESLREAMRAHDPEAFANAYTDDAMVLSHSERNRPSSAKRIEGRAAIEAWGRDFLARNLEHTLADEVIDGDRLAFVETCVYPSGELVVGAYVCETRDGKIAQQVGAEAWDE
jgi:ketosteroid isomerase-like protein